MRHIEIITEDQEYSITKTERIFGSEDNILEQIYKISGVDGLTASLKILDYGASKEDYKEGDPFFPHGRIISTIQVYPESFQGKGYAQSLYLEALQDGPLIERSNFRSDRATRAIDHLVAKNLIRRIKDESGHTLLISNAL